MNQKKETQEAMAIIQQLLDGKAMAAQQIAANVGISEKTVRKRIATANEILGQQNLGHLTARPRKGVVLECVPGQKEQLLALFARQDTPQAVLDQERLKPALRMILRAVFSDPVTVNQVADALYLSAPTAAKLIRECGQWLSSSGMQLQMVRNRGITLAGSESSYRQAVTAYLLMMVQPQDAQSELSYLFPQLDVALIQDCLVKVEKEWNFSFTDSSFVEILTCVCIASYENMQNQYLLKLNYDGEALEQYNEYNFAATVYSTVNERIGLENRREEVQYLTIQILCSRVISAGNTETPEEMVQEYGEKLSSFVKKAILVVSQVLNIDLTKDHDLYSGLLNHIRALMFRVKYGQPLESTVNAYVRKEFIMTLRVTWLISTLFEEYFYFSINDDELSYIALYIQSAIDSVSRPVHALLVMGQNRSVMRLAHERIMRWSRDISRLEDVTAHEFRSHAWPDADLILTTVPLEGDDPRVLLIKETIGEDDMEAIHSRINDLRMEREMKKQFHFDPVCHQLFEPDLLMTRVHYDSKEDLLRDMCLRLKKKGYASSRYLQSVMKREAAATTSIGQGVAIPHGNMRYTNESKIVIATLDTPIDWGNEKVDTVFLLNIRMNNEVELKKWQAFYRQFLRLTGSKELVSKINQFTNPVDLYYYLIQ